jgi:hypothetical protein
MVAVVEGLEQWKSFEKLKAWWLSMGVRYERLQGTVECVRRRRSKGVRGL